jgi:hypothetical protein
MPDRNNFKEERFGLGLWFQRFQSMAIWLHALGQSINAAKAVEELLPFMVDRKQRRSIQEGARARYSSKDMPPGDLFLPTRP